MKKNILIAISIILLCLYAFVRYRINKFYSLSPVNETYIKTKVFGKDSENRGYSDRAKKMIDEDVAIYNNDPNIKNLLINVAKSNRNIALSNSVESFHKNLEFSMKVKSCLLTYLVDKYKNEQIKHEFKYYLKENYESDNMDKLLNIVSLKYQKTISNDILIKLVARKFTEQECRDVKNN